MLDDYTPYQQKIIKRYYANQEAIGEQRLAELVTELYLAEGKKRDKLWASAQSAMEKMGVPAARIAHILSRKDIALLAGLLQDFGKKK